MWAAVFLSCSTEWIVLMELSSLRDNVHSLFPLSCDCIAYKLKCILLILAKKIFFFVGLPLQMHAHLFSYTNSTLQLI